MTRSNWITSYTPRKVVWILAPGDWIVGKKIAMPKSVVHTIGLACKKENAQEAAEDMLETSAIELRKAQCLLAWCMPLTTRFYAV